MSQKLYDLANELQRTFRQLPEYQAVAAVRNEINQDELAKELLDSYVAFNQSLQVKAQMGQLPDQDDQKRLQEFQEQLEGNELIRTYFEKQQTLSVYVSDLERLVFQPLQDLL